MEENDLAQVVMPKKRLERFIKSPARRTWKALTRFSIKFSPLFAITGLALGVAALTLSIPSFNEYKSTDPTTDGYVPPRSIANLVASTQKSTVTIGCELPNKKGNIGSGWAIQLKTKFKKEYPTTIITNYHVIEDCVTTPENLTITKYYGKKNYEAKIVIKDRKNDLAVLATKLKLNPLPLSQALPYPGYWVMAVGTAVGYEGSVSFGNVLNLSDTEVLLTANISHGNSGGPLVDNEGRVIGTNTYGAKGEQFNGAMSLDAMCAKIIECDGNYYWKE